MFVCMHVPCLTPGLYLRITSISSLHAEGGAAAGSDYLALSGVIIRWQANQRLSRFDLGNNDVPFDVTIIDDDIPEPTEYFEVHFEVQSTGYAYPSAIGRVTILDDDGGWWKYIIL